ncbi:MAG: helix-turn-helix domain-containing protein [Bdellovibrionales bacterium]|nr:helix-turn-helix domain-containing protein [Bdellovibrionales bacterium]
MKETGQLLKNRREELKVSIAEVSISTKITPRMLQAIENGEMTRLPARTFLRGFVKSYALFLKMNVETTLEKFNLEMDALLPQPVFPARDIESSSEGGVKSLMPSEDGRSPEGSHDRTQSGVRSESPSTKITPPLWERNPTKLQKVFFVCGFLGLFISIFFVYKMVQKYEREGYVEKELVTDPTALPKGSTPTLEAQSNSTLESKESLQKTHDSDLKSALKEEQELPAKPTAKPTAPLVVESKPQTITDPATSQTNSLEKNRDQNIKTPPHVNTQPVKTSEPSQPSERNQLEKTQLEKAPLERNQIVKTQPQKIQPQEIKAPASVLEAKTSSSPSSSIKSPEVKLENAKKENEKKTNEIIVEALDKVNLVFKLENGQERRVSLLHDQVHTLKAVGKVIIEISDGGAVNIVYNGRDIGVPGELKQPKKMTLQ